MTQYHKINGLWKRSEDGKRVLPEWSREEFFLLGEVEWDWLEKVDGTNVRIIYDGSDDQSCAPEAIVRGKTDKAELHKDLLSACVDHILEMPPLCDVFSDSTQESPVVLYGEGYGAGIQKGGAYRPDKGFVLFDVRVGRTWLQRKDVAEVAETLGLDAVPLRFAGSSIPEAIHLVREGFESSWEGVEPEGLVGTPRGGFLDRRGQRIITKIKKVDVDKLIEQGDIDDAYGSRTDFS